MKHWELEHAGELIRIEWNNAATFNLQTQIGGQWVDYHCFTCYNIDSDQKALEHAFEVIQAATDWTTPNEPYLQQPSETRTEYCARMGHDM